MDSILRDMMLGTCWSNVNSTRDFRQEDLECLKGISLQSRQCNEWQEIGNTRAILALPGFNKNDISIEIEGQTLKVIIHNWNGQAKMAGRTYKLSLGEHVNKEAVTAIMENGLLTVDTPSKPEYSRKIEVK